MQDLRIFVVSWMQRRQDAVNRNVTLVAVTYDGARLLVNVEGSSAPVSVLLPTLCWDVRFIH
jgi:hypothetical protein